MTAGARRLRQLLAQPGLLTAPGAFCALGAKLVEQAGFQVVYATGAGIANTHLGEPDVGLLTQTEMVMHLRLMTQVTSLPVIADMDAGYGNAINVWRAAREYRQAGVAAVQLEDQVTPKRCGHFEGKEIVATAEMVGKIQAAKDLFGADGPLIIARTDAIAVTGFDDALERIERYAEAGADILFIEAPRTEEQLRRIAGFRAAPQVVNLVEGGKTPLLPAADLEAMGFRIALYANAPLRAAVQAITGVLAHLHEHGDTRGVLDRLITMQERNRITGLPQIKALEERYLRQGQGEG